MSKSQSTVLLHEYFQEWVELYQVGAARDVTLQKYAKSRNNLQLLAPETRFADINRKHTKKFDTSYPNPMNGNPQSIFHNNLNASFLAP